MESSYTPVQWVFREVIEEEIEKKTVGKVFYFCKEEFICESTGRISKQEDVAGQGVFIQLDTDTRIRIDRIITLFGKPGPAYEEYDSYANACLNCSGDHGADLNTF